MGQIFSEGWEYIGRIDDNGFVFNTSDECFAEIDSSGYIRKHADFGVFGKIDEDGTIRDSSYNAVGRIQADGYVYIHSKRVCRVSSEFVEKITPKAWNAGQPSSYSGRTKQTTEKNYEQSDSGVPSFFTSKFFIKLVIGIVVGIIAMVADIGGIEMLLTGPILVFLFSLIYKIFN